MGLDARDTAEGGLVGDSRIDDGALTKRRHHARMHTGDAAPHPFWTLLLLYRLLWSCCGPALIAEAVVIAMILRAGWWGMIRSLDPLLIVPASVPAGSC
jgi:hypothetical protein